LRRGRHQTHYFFVTFSVFNQDMVHAVSASVADFLICWINAQYGHDSSFLPRWVCFGTIRRVSLLKRWTWLRFGLNTNFAH
jgi:hypothetical protein